MFGVMFIFKVEWNVYKASDRQFLPNAPGKTCGQVSSRLYSAILFFMLVHWISVIRNVYLCLTICGGRYGESGFPKKKLAMWGGESALKEMVQWKKQAWWNFKPRKYNNG